MGGRRGTIFLRGGAMTMAALAFPSAADAACRVGGDGVTYNRSGAPAIFKKLRPLQGMNCPSARYVMNEFLRPSYARSSGKGRLVTNFYDGYVTWYCGKLSRKHWRCDEYDSNTAFQFVAYRL